MRVLFVFVLLSISCSSFSQIFDKSISVGVSTLYTHRNLRNGDGEQTTQDTLAAKNSFEKPIFSYGAFIGYNHKLSKRFVIGIKLKYQRVGYTTRFVYNARSLIDPAIPVDFLEIFHIGSLHISGKYSFVTKNKFNVFVGSGFGIDRIIKNNIKKRKNPSDLSIEPDISYNKKSFSLSTNFGLGTVYKISSRSAINSSLVYNTNILDVNTDPIRLRLVNFGLNIGYVYSLSSSSSPNKK